MKYDYDQLEPEAFVEDDSSETIPQVPAEVVDTKGLGVWTFDRRRKIRKYISLTGRICKGVDAVHQYRKDKEERSAELQCLPRVELEMRVEKLLKNLNDIKNPSELRSWGLPPQTLERYALDGVTHLYDWQVQCLSFERVLRGGNLVYSAPTSGGKTLVSEILMLWRLALRPKTTVLFVAPFISLAEEKTRYFQQRWQDMHMGVKCFHGDAEGGSELTTDVDIAVCTIEKANLILNSLLSAGQEKKLSLIVVDEIHLLSDCHRGFLIELVLSKVRFLMPNQIQILGMSASLPNLPEVGEWLNASVYCTEYRPVSLEVKVCIPSIGSARILRNMHQGDLETGGVLEHSQYFTQKFVEERTIIHTKPVLTQPVQYATTGAEAAPPRQAQYHDNYFDQALFALCAETVRTGKSVIVFCGTKSQCEKLALRWSQIQIQIQQQMHGELSVSPQPQSELSKEELHMQKVVGEVNDGFISNKESQITDLERAVQEAMRGTATSTDASTQPIEKLLRLNRYLLLGDLNMIQGGICPILKNTVPTGCAYHHAGLSLEERKLIEDAFSKGTINILCATTTLAAGVNLPANRVIIRGTSIGNTKLSVASFRQMCGRAGRKGLDTSGDAILMVNGNSHEDKAKALELVCAKVDPLLSQIHNGSGGGLERLLLETIYMSAISRGTGNVRNIRDVTRFLKCTLLSLQYPSNQVREWQESSMQLLRAGHFILQARESESDENTADESGVKEIDGKLEVSHSILVKPLGKASVLSGISPRDALVNIKDLGRASEGLILQGGLHCVFLVTPPHPNIRVQWQAYADIYDDLVHSCPDITLAAEFLNISRARLEKYRLSPPSMDASTWSMQTKLDKRFYATIALFSLLQERPLDSIIQKMELTRGDIRALQHDSAMFCRTTVTFCEKLNWPLLAAILNTYVSLLTFGVPEELLPLARLGSDLMPPFRARMFHKRGMKDPQDIIEADENLIAELLFSSLAYESAAPTNVGMIKRDEEFQRRSSIRSSVERAQARQTLYACHKTAKKLKHRAEKSVGEQQSIHQLLQSEGVFGSLE